MRLSLFFLISFNFIFSQSTIDFEQNGVGADWTWTADVEPATFEIVDNPLQGDNVNNSSKVGKLTLEPSTADWGLAYSDGMDISFTSSNAIVTMDVYKTRAVNVAIKFEIPPNASYKEATATSSGAAGWETLTFDFSDQIDNGVTYTRIVIIPDFASRDETTISYFDNIEFSSNGSESSDPSDATLQNIYIDGAALTGFSPDQLSYSYTLNVGDNSVPDVTATASNPGAQVSINPASSVSENTIVTVNSVDGTATQVYTVSFQASYWDLKWSDEFDYDGAIDSNKWHHQTILPNGWGWYNGELQHYTDETSNSYTSDGTLKIVAKAEEYTDQGHTKQFTSARLNSKYAFTYGKVEVSAKLPTGSGTWPAIWMLGKNISEPGAYWQLEGFGDTSWPACGEIDIMEHWGTQQNYISSAMHTPSSYGGTINKGGQTISTASTEFHTYTLEWTEESMIFSVDGNTHYTYNPEDKNDNTWPFYEEQYIILNIAIESGTNHNTFVDTAMEIEYVRVYRKETLSVPNVSSRPKLVVYPNPANNRIAVSSEYNIETLSIYSISGQRMLHQKPQQHEVFVNLDLPAGIYLIQAHVAGEKLHQKLIVK